MYSVYLPAKYSKDGCTVSDYAKAAKNNCHCEKRNSLPLRKDFQVWVLFPQNCQVICLILRKTVRSVGYFKSLFQRIKIVTDNRDETLINLK
jgi:hypothetical protein